MKTPSLPLAALYARVSTSKQDTSLEIQIARALDYAQINGLEVPEALRFIECDVSGSVPLKERPKGRLMLNTMPLYKCRHVIFTKLDRLGRSIIDVEENIRRFEQQGVSVHITDSKLPTDPIFAKLFRQILGVFAEFEREMITRRIQENVDEKRAQGLQTGTIPYGWRGVAVPGMTNKQGKPLLRLEPDPAEMEWIQKMWNLREHARWSYGRIATELNRLGVRAKQGGRWQSGNVAHVLNNRTTREALEAKDAAAKAAA